MVKDKKRAVMIVLTCCILAAMPAYAASTSASVSITKNDTYKDSSSVGVSKKALFKASNKSSSSGNLTMEAHACWTGWPYTLESSTTIAPSGSYSYTEPQDKNSNFYMRLYGYNNCSASGSVTIK